MWTPDYFVRVVDFPPTVEGVTVPNDDGTFDIYLSSHLSPARRKECLEHELRHIFRDHFYSERPVEDLEREADGLAPAPVPAPAPKKPEPPKPPVRNVFSRQREAIPVFPSLEELKTYVDTLTAALQQKKA